MHILRLMSENNPTGLIGKYFGFEIINGVLFFSKPVYSPVRIK